MEVMSSIITMLKADAAIVAALGGQYIFSGHISQGSGQIPGIYLIENNETVRLRPGYASHGIRDHSPVLQADVWVRDNPTKMDTLISALDVAVFHTGVTNTRGWRRVSISRAFDPEKRAEHAAVRYAFEYSFQDT
jgi:hypothetical protein